MQAKGSNSQVVIDFESTFGQTPASPNGVLVPINSCGIRSQQNLNESSVIRGNRNPVAPIAGNIDVSGSITVPVDKRAFGYWLKALCGAPTTTGAGPYTHIFKPGNIQPSLVVEKGFKDINLFALYNGCKINQFSMSLGGDGELTANFDLLGAKETIDDTSFDNTPTAVSLDPFGNFQGAVKEGGATIATLTAVELAVACNLDGEQYCIGGQGFRNDIPEGMLQVTGSITALFENDTLLNKAISGTESSLEITLTNGEHSLNILIPELKYERNTPGIEGPQGISIQLPFRAYLDNNTDGTSIKFTLVNDVASYA